MSKVRPSHLNNIWASTSPLTYYWDNHRVNCKHRQVEEVVKLFMPGFLLGGSGFFYLQFAGHQSVCCRE
jgi:hypothetical protein